VKYYALSYQTVPDFIAKRADYRSNHLAVVKAAVERGELLLAGALSGADGGALLIFGGPTDEVAKAFAQNDPYVLNGLVTEWTVKPWAVVAGTLYSSNRP
jgi:hypothetical protein